MEITRSSLDTGKRQPDWFTGDVYVDRIATPTDTSRIGAGLVHFTPGARTHWHTHPYGQTIYVNRGGRALPARRRAGRGDPPG